MIWGGERGGGQGGFQDLHCTSGGDVSLSALSELAGHCSLQVSCRQQGTLIRISVCNCSLNSSRSDQLLSCRRNMQSVSAIVTPGYSADNCRCIFMSLFLATVQMVQFQAAF